MHQPLHELRVAIRLPERPKHVVSVHWSKLSLIGLVAAATASAEDTDRFLEFKHNGYTMTFDLSTVQTLVPGRFTIVATSIDHPESMKIRLKALEVTNAFCSKPDGSYPAPQLPFGPPDKPLKNLEVKTTNGTKMVTWEMPYSAAGSFGWSIMNCTRPDWYLQSRSAILNGIQTKYLFDCKRALGGMFLNLDDPPSAAMTQEVRDGTNMDTWYTVACFRVTKEFPMSPAK